MKFLDLDSAREVRKLMWKLTSDRSPTLGGAMLIFYDDDVKKRYSLRAPSLRSAVLLDAYDQPVQRDF